MKTIEVNLQEIKTALGIIDADYETVQAYLRQEAWKNTEPKRFIPYGKDE